MLWGFGQKTIIPPFLGQSLSPVQDGLYRSLCFLPGVNVHPYKASFPLWDSPEHPLPAPAPGSSPGVPWHPAPVWEHRWPSLGMLLTNFYHVCSCCWVSAGGQAPGRVRLAPPGTPSLPPALSFTHHTARKSIPGNWKSTAPCTAAARIPGFKQIFGRRAKAEIFNLCVEERAGNPHCNLSKIFEFWQNRLDFFGLHFKQNNSSCKINIEDKSNNAKQKT